MAEEFDILIVGAGFSGAVLAERLASQMNFRCLVIDKRAHIGGNSHDHYDRHGVLIHSYGPHYFRTNAPRIVEYLSQFTEWHPVEYKILSWTDGKYWQFPINLNTFEQFIGRPSTSEEMQAMLDSWRVPIENPKNSEEVVISQVGVKLYEMFFKNYTRKQWNCDPSDLDPSVCGRIPVRTNRDDRYLSEKFQALPAKGYTPMFQRILDHPNITMRLNTKFQDILHRQSFKKIIFTGPIDEYFDHCFGALAYRSLCFESDHYEKEFHLPAMQVNYPNDFEYTREVEVKHATGQKIPVTTVVREYPEKFTKGTEPYYPIPTPEYAALYKKYAERAEAEKNVHFVGRLATYRYYNMDQVIGMALTEFEKICKELPPRV